LEELAKDKDSYARAYVGSNPSTPIHTLEELAKDKDSYVRAHARLNTVFMKKEY